MPKKDTVVRPYWLNAYVLIDKWHVTTVYGPITRVELE